MFCAIVLSSVALLFFLLYTHPFCVSVCLFFIPFFYLCLFFPLLSSSINASFNPPWYWEVGHLLFRLIPPVCPVLKWKALMSPGTILEQSQTLNITVTGLSPPDTDTTIQKSHSATLRIDILLLQQIIKYRRSRITPAALTQKQNPLAE